MAGRKRKADPKKTENETSLKKAKTKDDTRATKRTHASRSAKSKQINHELFIISDSEDTPIKQGKPKEQQSIKRTTPAGSAKEQKSEKLLARGDDETSTKPGKSGNETPVKRASAPRRTKATHKSYEEPDTSEGEETSVKQAKSEDEPPVKRASAPRSSKAKRKNLEEPVKSEDDHTPTKRAKTKRDNTIKRTSAPRSAKMKRNDPEWLVTNEDSPLAVEGVLYSELVDPKTYQGFTQEHWEDLRSILPEDVPLNPDGYSIPIEFFRHNIDWRLGVREFQEDLAAGRCDPKWQAEAAEAMEQRARGEFDNYKEKIYEEFWGQKQKLDRALLAGESTTLKLEVMIENGVFRVGDEIVFTRVIGRNEKRVLIEKECKIESIGRKTMTAAIPPGQLKFLRNGITPATSAEPEPVVQGSRTNGMETKVSVSEGPQPIAENENEGDQPSAKGPNKDTLLGNFDLGWDRSLTKNGSDGKTLTSNSNSSQSAPSSSQSEPQSAVILHEFGNLKQLMDKIIEADGRLNPKDTTEVPAASPWKLMRVKRHNQDLGSLFEMRDEFYVYKLPHISKKSKK